MLSGIAISISSVKRIISCSLITVFYFDFVYPTQYHKYLGELQDSFQHGGISLEEMLVPIITLENR